jgi:hypothetical protein
MNTLDVEMNALDVGPEHSDIAMNGLHVGEG